MSIYSFESDCQWCLIALLLMLLFDNRLEITQLLISFDMIKMIRTIHQLFGYSNQKLSYNLISVPLHVKNFNQIDTNLLESTNIQITGVNFYGISSNGIRNLPDYVQCCILFGSVAGFLASTYSYWVLMIFSGPKNLGLGVLLTIVLFVSTTVCFLFNYFLFMRPKNKDICKLFFKNEEIINICAFVCWCFPSYLFLMCVLGSCFFTKIYKSICNNETDLQQNIMSNMMLHIFQTIGNVCVYGIFGCLIIIYTHMGSLFAGFICAVICGVPGPNIFCRTQELGAILMGKSIGNLSGIKSIKICGDMKDCNILSFCTDVEHLEFSNCPELTSIKGIHPEIKSKLRTIVFDNCVKLTDIIELTEYRKLESVLFVGCHNLQNIDRLWKYSLKCLRLIELRICFGINSDRLKKFLNPNNIVTDDYVRLTTDYEI
jgi:hypothetical protein